ncbi:MAG: transposase [Clostridia bacterium]|nr:transposase [Clostridia bacterium]
MPRIRKEPNRYWSKEEKLRIINMVINDGLSTEEVARNEDISSGMLRNWIKKYIEQGEESLENKRKPGNPLVKYSRRKELSDLEKLEYENMKLRIENERLKKGYMMKGDGSYVMYKK